MKQYFEQYTFWEDYLNGMYEIPLKSDGDGLVILSIKMLTDKELFLSTCKDILINWPISTMVNLTNKQCNRRAWLGQAACNYRFKVPEICTRIAWSKLTPIQQFEASLIAEKIIINFEMNYEKENTELYK